MSARGANPKNDQAAINSLFLARPDGYANCPESDKLRALWKSTRYDDLKTSDKNKHTTIFRQLLTYFEETTITNLLIDKASKLQGFLEYALARCVAKKQKDTAKHISSCIACVSLLTQCQTVSVANVTPQVWLHTYVHFLDVLRRGKIFSAQLCCSKEYVGNLGASIWSQSEYQEYIDTASTLGRHGEDASRGAHIAAEIGLAMSGGLRSQDTRDVKFLFGVDECNGIEVLLVNLSRADSKVTQSGHLETIPIVPHHDPHLDVHGLLGDHIIIRLGAVAALGKTNI